jgi:hypothetical protein
MGCHGNTNERDHDGDCDSHAATLRYTTWTLMNSPDGSVLTVSSRPSRHALRMSRRTIASIVRSFPIHQLSRDTAISRGGLTYFCPDARNPRGECHLTAGTLIARGGGVGSERCHPGRPRFPFRRFVGLALFYSASRSCRGRHFVGPLVKRSAAHLTCMYAFGCPQIRCFALIGLEQCEQVPS